jgi:hypothetical protein
MARLTEHSEHPNATRLALAAATRPVTIGVGAAGLTLAAALVAGSAVAPGVAVLALTVTTWLGLSTWDALFDAGFRKRLAGTQRPETPTRKAIDRSLPEALRVPLESALASSQRIKAAMDAADDVVQPHLLEAWGECEVLLDEAQRVAERGARLERYLISVSPEDVQRDRADLLKRAEKSSDADAAEAWRQAAGARAQQLETWRQIAGIYERIKAQLYSVVAALDEILARVVRIEASDLECAATATASLQGRVHELRGEIGVLERAATATLAEVANG